MGDTGSGTLTHLDGFLWVIINPGELFADGIHIAYRHDEAGHAVFDQIRPGAIGCRDYRQPRGHRLDDVAPESFEQGRKNVNVATPHDLAQLLTADVAHTPHTN